MNSVTINEVREPFGHSAVEKTVILLAITNTLISIVDQKHPMRVFYQGVVFLFEGWIQWIGWMMSLVDPLLPRTFTLIGTGSFIFSTAATVFVFLFAYLMFLRVWGKWCRPWLHEKGTFTVLEKVIRQPMMLYTVSTGMVVLLLVSVWRFMQLN